MWIYRSLSESVIMPNNVQSCQVPLSLCTPHLKPNQISFVWMCNYFCCMEGGGGHKTQLASCNLFVRLKAGFVWAASIVCYTFKYAPVLGCVSWQPDICVSPALVGNNVSLGNQTKWYYFLLLSFFLMWRDCVLQCNNQFKNVVTSELIWFLGCYLVQI